MSYYTTIEFQSNLKPESIARYRAIQKSEQEQQSLLGQTYLTWYSCNRHGDFGDEFVERPHYAAQEFALLLAPLMEEGDLLFAGENGEKWGFHFDGKGDVFFISYERTVSDEALCITPYAKSKPKPIQRYDVLFNPAKKEFVLSSKLEDIPKFKKLIREIYEPGNISSLPPNWAGDDLGIFENNNRRELVKNILLTFKDVTQHVLNRVEEPDEVNYTAITKEGMKSHTVEDDDSFVTCERCQKVFCTEFEGSTDKPELCDQCWSEVTQ